jgi:hypothetical protein
VTATVQFELGISVASIVARPAGWFADSIADIDLGASGGSLWSYREPDLFTHTKTQTHQALAQITHCGTNDAHAAPLGVGS